MTDISQNLQQIHRQIAEVAETCGRKAADIQLLAVSKTKPSSAIEEAFQAGQRAFGENYLQEALSKISDLADLDIEWHFIGRVQSNKTKEIAGSFHWLHSLSSLKHARRLSEQRASELPPLNVCIQVNLSGEDSKSGITGDELPTLAQEIATLPHIRLRGLMTMPDPNASTEDQTATFAQLRQLEERLNDAGLELDTLSMGMSGDLDAAICEGSTMVRIGTAIFGARDYSR